MTRIAKAAFTSTLLVSAAVSFADTKTYVATGSSNFGAPLAWSPTGAPASTDSIVLGNAITADATITIDSGGVVAGTTLDTTHTYTISLISGGPTAFNAGALNLNAGTLALAPGGLNTLRVSTLTIASSGATLNLHDNSAIIDNDYPAPLTLDTIRKALLAGAITGDAIGKYRIGFATVQTVFNGSSSGTFGGQTVTSNNGQPILLRRTLNGDSDLSGKVDFSDLVRLAMNWGQTGFVKNWTSGDFNYDGVVDFNDLVPLAQNYNGTYTPSVSELTSLGGESFAADWQLAQSLVPEPAMLAALASIVPVMIRRRRRGVR